MNTLLPDAPASAPAVVIYADDLHAFTYEQVAERLGVSLSTVEREVARGELREKRVGRAVRITASSLRRYLDSCAS
ncbi:helix-turn-helix domain-containing protein [Microbacterium sp.]|uniref:helix-turn-helix domain-containing protein n=1 Tax=Microbacterium sp. TaxID=51671 RepID=UPI003F9D99B0